MSDYPNLDKVFARVDANLTEKQPDAFRISFWNGYRAVAAAAVAAMNMDEGRCTHVQDEDTADMFLGPEFKAGIGAIIDKQGRAPR